MLVWVINLRHKSLPQAGIDILESVIYSEKIVLEGSVPQTPETVNLQVRETFALSVSVFLGSPELSPYNCCPGQNPIHYPRVGRARNTAEQHRTATHGKSYLVTLC